MVQVLLIEDDPIIAKVLKYYLSKDGGYIVRWAQDAGEAFAFARDRFDVILIDVMLPDVNGIELCSRLRVWHNCPIIFISCIDDSDTIIRALEMGGDDYLVKPFDNKILAARIQANLRRVRMEHEEKPRNALICGGFTLDAEKHCVIKNETNVPLSPMEYRILLFFMQNPYIYFSTGELYKRLWGKDSYGDVRTVLVHIHNIRKKIEEDSSTPVHLVNDWGQGYMFDPKGSAQ